VTSHCSDDETDQSADRAQGNSTQEGSTDRFNVEAAILARRARCKEKECSARGAAQEADARSLERTARVTSHSNFVDISACHSYLAGWVG
jgi:hypothetical protein